MSTTDKQKKIIGRFERVDLPDWDLSGIEANIDSGAYSSSLHCHRIEEYEKDGERRVRFQLLDPEHDLYGSWPHHLSAPHKGGVTGMTFSR